ncbi:MAG: O-methyltransferase [Lachnospiraceae bacterium]|nr:O-methyltransferase [Lachnospiraceae bacterium]
MIPQSLPKRRESDTVGDGFIEEERVAAYIESLNAGNKGFLAELEKRAKQDRIPIIRPQVQNLLKTIITGLKPGKILEVGTAVGFSAILMAQSSPSDCRITTIENYEKRIPLARENFKASGYSDRITLIEGDAAKVLKDIKDITYDLVFMDAAKGQYLNFFEDVMRVLRPGGILVSDNVLQDGDIIQSRFAVRRRDRTIHSRMREYLYVLTHDERLSTTILPMGDGVTVSAKRHDCSVLTG